MTRDIFTVSQISRLTPSTRFGVREAARSSSTAANRTLPEGGAKMMFIQPIRDSVIVFKSTRMRVCLLSSVRRKSDRIAVWTLDNGG